MFNGRKLGGASILPPPGFISTFPQADSGCVAHSVQSVAYALSRLDSWRDEAACKDVDDADTPFLFRRLQPRTKPRAERLQQPRKAFLRASAAIWRSSAVSLEQRQRCSDLRDANDDERETEHTNDAVRVTVLPPSVVTGLTEESHSPAGRALHAERHRPEQPCPLGSQRRLRRLR
jgi:hypothetical protein